MEYTYESMVMDKNDDFDAGKMTTYLIEPLESDKFSFAGQSDSHADLRIQREFSKNCSVPLNLRPRRGVASVLSKLQHPLSFHRSLSSVQMVFSTSDDKRYFMVSVEPRQTRFVERYYRDRILHKEKGCCLDSNNREQLIEKSLDSAAHKMPQNGKWYALDK